MYAHYACYYALHALCSLLAVYVTISLLEYLIHRHLMHRPRVAKFFDSSYLLETSTSTWTTMLTATRSSTTRKVLAVCST